MPAQYPGNAINKAARSANGGYESAFQPVVATGWRPNEPAGMTPTNPLTFDVNLSSDPDWSGYNVGNLGYAVDPTSPSPGDNVGRLNYPVGKAGGGQTVGISNLQEPSGVSVQRLYWCIGLKMSPTFQYHSTGTNKIFFINVSGFSGGGDPYFCNIDADTSPAQFRGVLQGPLSKVFPGSVNARMNKDEWYVCEGEMLMNTPGNADGIYRQWVNGVLTNEDLAVEYVNTVYEWNSFPGINNTWGGGGDVVTAENSYIDVSELYVSWSET